MDPLCSLQSPLFTSGRLIFHQPINLHVGGTAGCGRARLQGRVSMSSTAFGFPTLSTFIPDFPTPNSHISQLNFRQRQSLLLSILQHYNSIHRKNYALQVNIHPAGPRFVDSYPEPSLVSQRHRRQEPPEPQLRNPAIIPIQHLQSLQLTPIPLLPKQLTSKPQPWHPAAHLHFVL
jgi:hypothetical protein